MTRFSKTPRVDALRKTPTGGVAVYDELRRLMPRDRRILDLLAKHHVLTTDQITAVEFDHVHTARNRLNLLRQRGVLARFRDGVRPGSEQWRWTLDQVGAAYLAFRDGKPTPRLSTTTDKINSLAASPRLSHLLEVNDVYVQLAAYARTHPGAQVSLWRSEEECRQITGTLAYPDGFGVFAEDGRTVSFWLEVDLGTEPNHRILAKLPGYEALARTTGRTDVAVLIRLHTKGREESLHRQLVKHPAVNAGLFVATSILEHHPAGPVWQPAATSDRYRLADLSPLLSGQP
jgi:Replication-relaxation